MMNKRNINKNEYPRLLVISNQCFSKVTSNGRTLGNFITGWPKNKIAQFYLNGTPDSYYCSNYFCVSDIDALKAFLLRRLSNGKLESRNDNNILNTNKRVVNIKRSATTMIAREIIWKNKKWMNFGFNDWLDEFRPQIILLQVGDSGFMLDIAVNISKKYNALLFLYNSENYYFKEYDYFRAKGISHLIYPFFRRIYCKAFRRAIAIAQKSIYICEELKKEYDKEFNLPSIAIYTATDIKPIIKNCAKYDDFSISYLGNLGVGRVEALCCFADVLQNVNKSATLHVYGNIYPNAINLFSLHDNIRYEGFVSYKDVISIMHKSDLLLHVESFDAFYQKDLKFAFSTKIADSLACGTPFLLFAPETFACSKYLKSNSAAFVSSNKEHLQELLKCIINDTKYRNTYVQNALNLVNNNHKVNKNRRTFQNILLSK